MMVCFATMLRIAPCEIESFVPVDETFPSEWVLLDDRPLLWPQPGLGPAKDPLIASAGDILNGESGAPGDDVALYWIFVRHGGQFGWLPEALLAPRPCPLPVNSIENVGREPVDRFRGLPPEYAPDDLISVNFGYERNRTYLLRREAAQACERMIRRARLEGLNIRIVSAYRPYDTQRRVYLNKLKRSDWKQRTVAKPGHSEHQLGTTVDLVGADESALLREIFATTPEGLWLRDHAPDFGFALSYTGHNEARTGYASEPWHFRYYGPELARRRHVEALGLSNP